ncbi:MAG: ATP synthase F0 subunit B, partial [Betaproteobacteria bacterium]|nr:ATP synthase F0 subunit B [Betaproteobacteria bacterium]
QSQAETLVRKAKESMEREKSQLEAEMRKELGRLVARTTEKVVGRVLTPQDEERLRKEAVEQVAR